IALEENSLQDIKSDFNVFAQTLKSEAKYMDVLTHPRINKIEKKSLLTLAISTHANPMLVNFMMILIDKDRIDLINEILVAFNELVNKHLGIVEGTVYSAVELTGSQLTELKYLFTKKLNQEVKFNVVVDPSLLGGYKVSLNNMVYDNSIKLQLKQLKQNLMSTELK
ncbi:MAG: ATP synthase F1 subunit delta, partial [Turicibacter sp.]